MVQAFAFLGYITVFLFIFLVVFNLLRAFYLVYLAPILTPFQFKSGPNSWAIVTGSTDGIGLEYARKLAEKGFHLLLISRSQDKLERVKKSILKDYPSCPGIEILTFDFNNTDYTPIEAALINLPTIDVLVNNVGHSYWTPELFTLQKPWSEVEKIININIFSTTRMTYLVLPRMQEERKGIIINVSSFAARVPVPCLAVYGATKSYMDYFSRALSVECRRYGIIIQSVLPQFVATNMSALKPSLGVPDAKTYVNSAFKTIGYETRTSGYWNHRLKALGASLFCLFSEVLLSHIIFIFSLKLRRKNYRRKIESKND